MSTLPTSGIKWFMEKSYRRLKGEKLTNTLKQSFIDVLQEVFLKFLQITQKNTCAGSLFKKRDSGTGVFL